MQDTVPGVTRAAQRILVVEDERDARTILRLLLELRGVEVHVANSGGAATTAAERVHPDIVLLDFTLPDMTGAEVARRLRRRGHARRIVALSARDEPAVRGACLAAGCDVFVSKPADLTDLERVLDEVVLAAV